MLAFMVDYLSAVAYANRQLILSCDVNDIAIPKLKEKLFFFVSFKLAKLYRLIKINI